MTTNELSRVVLIALLCCAANAVAQTTIFNSLTPEALQTVPECADFSVRECKDKDPNCSLVVGAKDGKVRAYLFGYPKVKRSDQEDMGFYRYENLPDETKAVHRRPRSGFVALDGFGWPQPLIKEMKGNYSLLESGEIPCAEGLHVGGALCYTVMLISHGSKPGKMVISTSGLTKMDKQVMNLSEAKKAARCVADAVFSVPIEAKEPEKPESNP